MSAGRYVDMADGYGWHIESDVEGVTMCGRRVVDVDERVEKATLDERFRETGDKPGYCFDCLVVAQGGSVHPRRREIHFS